MNRFVYSNPALCIGCNTCLAACKEAHKAHGLQDQARISIVRDGEISLPIACRHCENAPCADVCPVNAITMNDNAVVLNEARCIGCKLCAFACPFGVITISNPSAKAGASGPNPKTDEGKPEGSSFSPTSITASKKPGAKVAVKCDLCDFSENGPECVRACPTDALFLVDEKALKRSITAKRKAAAKNMPPLTPSKE